MSLPGSNEFEREGFRDETPNLPLNKDWISPDPLGSLLGVLPEGVVDTGLFAGMFEAEARAEAYKAEACQAVAESMGAAFGTPEPFAPSSLESFSLDEGAAGSVDHAKALAALEEENRRLKAQIEQTYTERQRRVQLFKDVLSGGVYWLLAKLEPNSLSGPRAPVAASSDWILKNAQDLAGRLKQQQPSAAEQLRTEFPKTGEAF